LKKPSGAEYSSLSPPGTDKGRKALGRWEVKGKAQLADYQADLVTAPLPFDIHFHGEHSFLWDRPRAVRHRPSDERLGVFLRQAQKTR
jgi:hypothetical protein